MNRTLALLILLTICGFIGLVSMPISEYPGDASLVRMESVHLITTGKLGVEPEVAKTQPARGQYFIENEKTGRWFSKYGVANTWIYALPVFWETAKTGKVGANPLVHIQSLNYFNLAFHLISALYLFLLCGRYTKSPLLLVIFVLISLYATVWFNYLRAQTFEIYQMAAVLAITHHVLLAMERHNPAKDGKWKNIHLGLAGVVMAILVLSKSLFVLLEPVFFLVLLFQLSPPPISGAWFRKLVPGTIRLWPFVVPCTLGFLVLLWVNWFRTGNPLDNGYTQWENAKNLMGGNIFKGLAGFLFDKQFSIFQHFPILLVAIPSYFVFFRKYRVHAVLFLGVSLMIFGVSSKFFDWTGQWCIGPRYVMPVLPLLALPAMLTFEWIRDKAKPAAQFCFTSLILAATLWSAWLQLANNATPFFAFYYLKDTFLQAKFPGAEEYFSRNQNAVIAEFLAYRRTGSHPLMDEAKKRLTEEDYTKLRQYVFGVTRSGYYWFP